MRLHLDQALDEIGGVRVARNRAGDCGAARCRRRLRNPRRGSERPEHRQGLIDLIEMQAQLRVDLDRRLAFSVQSLRQRLQQSR